MGKWRWEHGNPVILNSDEALHAASPSFIHLGTITSEGIYDEGTIQHSNSEDTTNENPECKLGQCRGRKDKL